MMKPINNKLIAMARYLATLSAEELEKAIINRAILDRIYLMRKNQTQDYSKLLESFRFRDLIILESYIIKNNLEHLI